MTDEQLSNAVRAAVTTQIFNAASEAAAIQHDVYSLVRDTIQTTARKIQACDTPEDVANLALMLTGQYKQDEATVIDALRNLLSCVAKELDAPISSDTHLNTAIRILAKATTWRPASREHQQILDDTIESGVE